MQGDAVPFVVVGAGPAGCAAALALRRRGWEVSLLDRACFPRSKVCGDVLVPGALAELARLELPVAELRELGGSCAGARVVAPNGSELRGIFTARGQAEPCWTVPRWFFDAWLVEQCRRAGIRVETEVEARGMVRDGEGRFCGVRVRAVGHRDEVERPARWVIAADGAGGVLAAELGAGKLPPEHLGMAWRGYARLPAGASELEIFTHGDCLPGCAWVLPVGGDRYNVGLGLIGSHNPRQTTPKKLFEELRRKLPALARRLGDADITEGHGWILPIATARIQDKTGARRLVGAPGLLLAGDAAALIDPLTGHGIHNALHSGRLAGELLAAAAGQPGAETEAVAAYDQALERQVMTPMHAGFRLRHFSQYPMATTLLVGTARHLPLLRRWLMAMIGHSTPSS